MSRSIYTGSIVHPRNPMNAALRTVLPGRQTMMNERPELYVATDIESNGPSPGHHSMLSFGSVAFTPDKTIISTFTRNLELLQGASEHPQTMAWWRTQQDAWRACRINPTPPGQAMTDYVAWLRQLGGSPHLRRPSRCLRLCFHLLVISGNSSARTPLSVAASTSLPMQARCSVASSPSAKKKKCPKPGSTRTTSTTIRLLMTPWAMPNSPAISSGSVLRCRGFTGLTARGWLWRARSTPRAPDRPTLDADIDERLACHGLDWLTAEFAGCLR